MSIDIRPPFIFHTSNEKRISPEDVSGRQKTSKEKIDQVISYLLGGGKNVQIIYKIEEQTQSSLSKSENMDAHIKMSIKDEFRSFDGDMILRKLWTGQLKLFDFSNYEQETYWINLIQSNNKKNSTTNNISNTALPFIRSMEYTYNQLQQECKSIQKERDEYRKAALNWKADIEKLRDGSEKSFNELTSNFLILYNNTKKRLQYALKELDREKLKSQKKNLNSTNNNVCAKEAMSMPQHDEPVDHEDEHDLPIFDDKDVEKYASGLAVTKYSVNPNKLTCNDNITSSTITQSQDKIDRKHENYDVLTIQSQQTESNHKIRANTQSSLSQPLSQESSFTPSIKNPYTGALEIWDLNSIFTEDQNICDKNETNVNFSHRNSARLQKENIWDKNYPLLISQTSQSIEMEETKQGNTYNPNSLKKRAMVETQSLPILTNNVNKRRNKNESKRNCITQNTTESYTGRCDDESTNNSDNSEELL